MSNQNDLPDTDGATLEPKMAPKVIVDSTMSDESLLECDLAGMFLCFAAEPGSFKELSDETFKSLSSPSRSAYVAIKEVHTRLKNYDHSGATPGIEFGEQYATGAPAYAQIHDLNLKPGLVPHFTRPDLIADRESRGWRKATAADIVSSKAPAYKDNSLGMRALRMKDGQIESVLMVKNAEQDRADRIARDKKREFMGQEKSKAVAEEAKGVTRGPTETLT
jgi:hypothetical protein